ncbi:MAG: polysaccharide biosynthesis/export family protein [Candidatus Melainabacteria bacterium]
MFTRQSTPSAYITLTLLLCSQLLLSVTPPAGAEQLDAPPGLTTKSAYGINSPLVMTNDEFTQWMSRRQSDMEEPDSGIRNISLSSEPIQARAQTFDYLLAPGDVISVLVQDRPQFSSSDININVNGFITLPILGDIYVKGKSKSELLAEISEAYKEYLVDPHVDIVLKKTRPQFTYILGAVKNPGPYRQLGKDSNGPQDSMNSAVQDLKLSTAIANSGGIDETSDWEHVHIYNDSLKTHREVNLRTLVVFGDVVHDPDLNPDDVVYVPRLPDDRLMALSDLKLASASTLGKHEFPIRIHGMVKNPNVYYMKNQEMTLQGALAMAGGLMPDARLDQIVIARTMPDGSLQKIGVNGKKHDLLLHPNDIVMVTSQRRMRTLENTLVMLSRIMTPPLQGTFLLRNLDSVYGIANSD